jgi:prolyl-tRNA synthetase
MWCPDGKEADESISRSRYRSKTLLGEQDEKAPSAGAKSLCIPFDQDRWGCKIDASVKCVGCGEAASKLALFGRSY